MTHLAHMVTNARHLRTGAYLGVVVAWRRRPTDVGGAVTTVRVRLAHPAGQSDTVDVVLHGRASEPDVCLGTTVVVRVLRCGCPERLSYIALEHAPKEVFR